MSKNSKILIISIFAALVVVAGAVLICRLAMSPEAVEKNNFILNFVLPEEIVLAGESIPLTWTDNNDNENLIIQSDRKYYDGRDSSEVFFSITNISAQDQETDIYFWFDDGQKKVASVEKLNSGENSKFQSRDIRCPADIGCPKIESNRKDIKGYTSGGQFNDAIASGQTNYYKAVIKYPANQNQSEFFIEAMGDKDAYGHLDPYLAGGLVGMWSFSGSDTNWTSATAGTTNDLSGSNNTGTMTNMSRSTSPVPGVSGQALNFDGVDDYVQISDTHIVTTGNWSIGAWIKPDSSAAGRMIFVTGEGVGNGSGFRMRIDATTDLLRVRAIVGTNSEEDIVSLSAIPEDGTWTHVVGVKNGTSLMLYINSVLNNTLTLTTATMDYTADDPIKTRIGISDESDSPFNGLIDDVRIYNRALSASEITDLYRIGAARMKVNTPKTLAGPQGGLVGNWTFNGPDIDNSKNLAYDRSGQNNNGTLTNMATSTRAAPGISGQALNFDGSDDYVNVPSLNGIAYPFTYSAWFKTSLGDTSKTIVSQDRGGYSQQRVQLYFNGVAGFCYNVKNETEEAEPCDTSITQDDNWHHAAGVSSASNNHKLYIDGLLKNTNTNSVTIPNSVNRATIGNWPAFADYNFNGLIDEVRIYDRALTSSEITDLYRIGAARLKVNTSIQKAGPQGGLVGNWTFNGPDIDNSKNLAYDRSGQSNNGTLTNMATSTRAVAGISGQALNFDGTDDYINLGDINALDGLTTLTIAFWIKPNNLTGDYQHIIDKSNSSLNSGFVVQTLAGGSPADILVFINNGALTSKWVSNVISNGVWTHIAFVYNGTQVAADRLKIYMNGASQSLNGTDTIPTSIAANASPLYIAYPAQDPTNDLYFKGITDEVRIYNRALSESEITDLYRIGAARVKIKQ